MESADRTKKLRRSVEDRVLSGVSGGVAQYLGVDSMWVRLGFVASALVWGLGVMAYAVLWISLPEEPEVEGDAEEPPLLSKNLQAVAGVIVLSLGLLLLLIKIVSLIPFQVIAAVILVGVGAFLLLNRTR